jgi:hypothetical protein
MRFLEALSKAISNSAPDLKISEREITVLSKLNPQRFDVENVRALLNVSRWHAKEICETGVRQQVFDKCVEVICPGGGIGASGESEDNLPEVVECRSEENGFTEINEIPTNQLQVRVYYGLHADDSRTYERTG